MAFNLKDLHRETTLIDLILYKGVVNGRFKYSTGLSIEVKYWNSDSQMAITKGVSKQVQQRNIFINSELSKYSLCLENAINNANLQELPLTKEYLREQFDIEFKPATVKKTTSADYETIFNFFIEELKSGKKLTKKGKTYSKGRIEKYTMLLLNLKKFFRKNASIYDINMQFLQDYAYFRNSQDTALNTLSYDIVMIKAVLKSTYKSELHTNKIFENEDFKINNEDVEKEYLNDNELELLYNYNFTDPRHVRTRDVFIICAYTGLRYIDMFMLNENNIIDGQLLKVIPEKTSEPIYLPIHWKVKEILMKYDGKIPKAYSVGRMRDNIKEICRIAGINEKSYYKQTRGGKVIKEVKEKWERISNHTARRSFATNLYLAGFDSISIMRLTGHRTEEAFMRYVCVTQRQMADRMKEHKYFKKP